MVEKRVLTHYMLNSPTMQGWRKLLFITWKNGRYYHGFNDDPIAEEKLRIEEKAGSIFRLPTPVPISSDQSVWISEEGKVYLAPKNDPFAANSLIELAGLQGDEQRPFDILQLWLGNLWKGVGDVDSLDNLVKSADWEMVLYFLKVQLLAVKKTQLPKWIFYLLSQYELKYQTLFNRYCASQKMKIDFLNSRIYIAGENGNVAYMMDYDDADYLNRF